MKRKKIAFCFSGQARTFDTCYPFIKKNLFESAKKQGFNYDIFACVEDDEDVWKVEKYLKCKKIIKVKSKDVEKIYLNSKFRDFTKKRIIEGGDIGTGFLLFYQQLYKLKKVYFLIENSNDYEKIVRIRFDMLPLEEFDFKNKNNLVPICFNKRDIDDQVKNVNDHFSISNSKDSLYFFDLISNIEILLKDKKLKKFSLFLCFIKVYDLIFISLIRKINNRHFKLYSNILRHILILCFAKDMYRKYRVIPEKILYISLRNNHIKFRTKKIKYLLVRKNNKDTSAYLI